jgi:undecaprenyl-diphosphatase
MAAEPPAVPPAEPEPWLAFGFDRSARRLAALTALLLLAAITLTVAAKLAGGGPHPGDIWLTQRVQDLRSGALDPVITVINELGTAFAYVPFALALAAIRFGDAPERARNAATIALLLALALRFWSPVLQETLQLPRPEASDGIIVTAREGAYDFPAGHVYAYVTLYGAIALHAPLIAGRRLAPWLRGLFLALLLPVGLARVYDGGHWPSTVLATYVWGASALGVVAVVRAALTAPEPGRTPPHGGESAIIAP